MGEVISRVRLRRARLVGRARANIRIFPTENLAISDGHACRRRARSELPALSFGVQSFGSCWRGLRQQYGGRSVAACDGAASCLSRHRLWHAAASLTVSRSATRKQAQTVGDVVSLYHPLRSTCWIRQVTDLDLERLPKFGHFRFRRFGHRHKVAGGALRPAHPCSGRHSRLLRRAVRNQNPIRLCRRWTGNSAIGCGELVNIAA